MKLQSAALFALAALGLVAAGPSHSPPLSRHRSLANSLEKRQSSGRKCPNRRSKPATPPAPPPSNDASTSGCFPSAGFNMPDNAPGSTDGWWCDPKTEYAFLGFSYAVSACQSKNQLTREFKDIKNRFKGRYVRLYGACDRKSFNDDLVEAAWEAGIGIYHLIWFGFDGGNIWQKRRDALFSNLHNNPKAKFVVRGVQFGSEPLFDHVLSPSALATQVKSARKNLDPLGIPVTVSDMAYGFTSNGGAQPVLDASDFHMMHALPFFSSKASTGKAAWPLVSNDIDFFVKHGGGKKIYLSENGWPSVTSPGVSPNSRAAVSNVQNEQDYFNLLDSKCTTFKTKYPQGGVGWFAHLYSEDQGPGYGILHSGGGAMKFPFAPRTHC